MSYNDEKIKNYKNFKNSYIVKEHKKKMQYDIQKYIELEDQFKLEHNNINKISNIIIMDKLPLTEIMNILTKHEEFLNSYNRKRQKIMDRLIINRITYLRYMLVLL